MLLDNEPHDEEAYAQFRENLDFEIETRENEMVDRAITQLKDLPNRLPLADKSIRLGHFTITKEYNHIRLRTELRLDQSLNTTHCTGMLFDVLETGMIHDLNNNAHDARVALSPDSMRLLHLFQEYIVNEGIEI